MIRPDFSTLKTSRLFLLLLLIFVACFIFSTILSVGVVYLFYGPKVLHALSEENPLSSDYIGALRLMQAINHAGSFLVTSFVFIQLAENSESKKFLQGNIPSGVQLWLVFMLIIIATPWIAYVYEWNRNLQLPFAQGIQESLKNYEAKTEILIHRMLSESSTSAFLQNLIVMALLPAVGEELLFRGIVQRLFYRWWGHIHSAIWVTAFLFSIMHFSFSGLLPRLMLGIIFGYLFYFSRNIWLPVAAHFINNSMALLAALLEKRNVTDTPYQDFGYFSNPWINLLSLALTFVIMAWFALNRRVKAD